MRLEFHISKNTRYRIYMKPSDIHKKTLEDDIKKSRPHLKPNSIATYKNALVKIYKLAGVS